jgi:hypothetical protein
MLMSINKLNKSNQANPKNLLVIKDKNPKNTHELETLHKFQYLMLKYTQINAPKQLLKLK